MKQSDNFQCFHSVSWPHDPIFEPEKQKMGFSIWKLFYLIGYKSDEISFAAVQTNTDQKHLVQEFPNGSKSNVLLVR